ncbi:MAG: signal peptidase I [Candidatus Kaiserbacteria bacterium]|nr:signal peptidase I [Candidatus Kaiserbacteria bacterium]
MNNTVTQNTATAKKAGWYGVDITKTIVMTAGIVSAIFVWFFGFRPFLVNGISMYPSFNASFVAASESSSLIAGDYLIIDAFSYRFLEDPQRFDVIVAKSPIEPGKHLLKRIIGLPNEHIRLSDTTIEVTTADNTSFTLHEPYINQEQLPLYKNQTIQLGGDQYLILGDNRMNSLDSRVWGALTKDRIIGRVVLRLYPFDEAAVLPGNVDLYPSHVL